MADAAGYGGRRRAFPRGARGPAAVRLPAAACLSLFLLSAGLAPSAAAEDVIQPPEEFLAEVFEGDVPEPTALWVTKPMRERINRILGHHSFRGLRIRFWRQDERTAWILEEIGKYKPITTGLVVDGDRLERIRVLVYRESHGWEVKHDFFTDQFRGLTLRDDLRLSDNIDGISGATLSVRALTNLARLALYLDAQADDET